MDLKSSPKDLIDAVQSIVGEAEGRTEVNVSELDSDDKRKYEVVSKSLRSNQIAVIDVQKGTVVPITSSRFDDSKHVKIVEDCSDDHIEEEEEEPKYDPTVATESSIKTEAHQISTQHHASQEPYSAVGHRRQMELPKRADVVDETIHVAGEKQDGFRLMFQFPGGRATFFPESSSPAATTLDELAILLDILPEEYHPFAFEAISHASMRPHMKGIHQGNVPLEESKELNERISSSEKSRLQKGVQEVASGISKIVDIVSTDSAFDTLPTELWDALEFHGNMFGNGIDPVDVEDDITDWVRKLLPVIKKL
jgi:hypothetical protein